MSRIIKKYWPLMGLALLIPLVAFYVTIPAELSVKDALLSKVIPGEGLKLKDIHYTQQDPDKGMMWVLDAKEVALSKDRKTISFRDFHLKVERVGKPSFDVTGRHGDYQRGNGKISLWGDVLGASENGFRFATDRVMINEKRGHLWTDEPVKIWGHAFSVSGKGLFADLKKEKVRVLSDVTTVIEEEPSI